MRMPLTPDKVPLPEGIYTGNEKIRPWVYKGSYAGKHYFTYTYTQGNSIHKRDYNIPVKELNLPYQFYLSSNPKKWQDVTPVIKEDNIVCFHNRLYGEAKEREKARIKKEKRDKKFDEVLAKLDTKVDPQTKVFMETLERLKEIRPKMEANQWQNLAKGKSKGDFNASQYFDVFKHLSMEKGYTLEYVYYFQSLGGEPVLYARNANIPPYKTYHEYQKNAEPLTTVVIERKINPKMQNAMKAMVKKDKKRLKKAGWTDEELDFLGNVSEIKIRWPNYLKHVKTDGTKQSYLEFIALFLLGEQFYLFWHACYNDKVIACCKQQAVDIMKKAGMDLKDDSVNGEIPIISLFGKVTPKAIAKLDVTPRVSIKEKEVTISLVTFSNWGGFTRETYTLTKAAPHKLINLKTKKLIDYHCGVSF